MRALYARRKILFALVCALVICVNFARTITFTAHHWNEPWPEGRLAIDGQFYLAGAKQIWGAPHFWQLHDNFHAPGFQVLLGLLLRITAPERGIDTAGLIHASKVILLSLFAATLLLLLRLGVKAFSWAEGTLAAVILSASLAWCFYANMLQYEVLAGFLLTLAIACSLEMNSARRCARYSASVVGGFSLALLAWIHSRFLLFGLLPLICVAWRGSPWRERKTECALMLACVLFPILLWLSVRSWEAGTIVPLRERSSSLFHLGNNPNSLGVNFPFPLIAEPSGWAFIGTRPGQFLWLVCQRFLYFWGIKPDWWTVPQMVGPHYEYDGWSILSFIALAIGLGLAMREKGHRAARLPLYFAIAAAIAPPLFIFASGRFLVPLLPLVALFQAKFFLSVGRKICRRLEFFRSVARQGKAGL